MKAQKVSLVLKLARLPEELAERVRADPALADEIGLTDKYDDILKAHGLGIERKLSADEQPEDILDLGKDWDLMNHLFTKRSTLATIAALGRPSWPSAFLTSGGQRLGSSGGYDRGRLLGPAEVGDVDRFLADFDAEAALSALTNASLADIYSHSSLKGANALAEARRLALLWTRELRSFVRRSVTSGSSIYIFMT